MAKGDRTVAKAGTSDNYSRNRFEELAMPHPRIKLVPDAHTQSGPVAACDGSLNRRIGKIAGFHDRTVWFLVMERNPVTKALEPVVKYGEPQYYYLPREVDPK